MNAPTLLNQFPIRRLKPYDGLVVTADVWEEAHNYHRQELRYHQLLQHGAGILTGLEVVASDPPDSSVYIQPGVAVDAAGQVIVVPEALSFDLGRAQGQVYLRLSYDESQPQPDESTPATGDAADVRLFIHAQYALEGSLTLGTQGIELARVNRTGGTTPIQNAANPARQQLNTIDLRFRQAIGAATESRIVSMAVCHVGPPADRAGAHGADVLASALNHAAQLRICVDEEVALTANLSGYTLVYLVGHGDYQFDPAEMNAIYAYLQSGGTLYYESCRHGLNREPSGDAVFLEMLTSLGVSVAELPLVHPLRQQPNFFAALPAGYEPAGGGTIKLGGGVIFSTFDHGCVWRGEQRGGPPTRETIRAAHEWGENLIQYSAVQYRQKR